MQFQSDMLGIRSGILMSGGDAKWEIKLRQTVQERAL